LQENVAKKCKARRGWREFGWTYSNSLILRIPQTAAFARIALNRDSGVKLSGLAPPSAPDCSFEKRAMRDAVGKCSAKHDLLKWPAKCALATDDIIILGKQT
jgi:hypothetical protein